MFLNIKIIIQDTIFICIFVSRVKFSNNFESELANEKYVTTYYMEAKH